MTPDPIEVIRQDHKKRVAMMDAGPGVFLERDQITVLRRAEADVAYLLTLLTRTTKLEAVREAAVGVLVAIEDGRGCRECDAGYGTSVLQGWVHHSHCSIPALWAALEETK